MVPVFLLLLLPDAQMRPNPKQKTHFGPITSVLHHILGRCSWDLFCTWFSLHQVIRFVSFTLSCCILGRTYGLQSSAHQFRSVSPIDQNRSGTSAGTGVGLDSLHLVYILCMPVALPVIRGTRGNKVYQAEPF